MRFASLGSGSKGNGTLVETTHARLLVDCGFGPREATRRLNRLGCSPEDLSAILVTHEHSDHIAGVIPLAKRHNIPVYATHGTAMYKDLAAQPWLRRIRPGETLTVEGAEVTAVAVPHDAREPCQFVIRSAEKCLGVLTDLGSVTPHICEQYAQCDALVLEFNHDTEMLANGPYPGMLKRRVGGRLGHLNNQQAADLLRRLPIQKIQRVVMAHLSEKNNTPDLARAAIDGILSNAQMLLGADQQAGFDWLAIE